MSATLGVLLKELDPSLKIHLYECGQEVGAESSNAWNNAGTGHAGICELSYTTGRGADGSVDVRKAIAIYAEFERSKQFWAHAVRRGIIADPDQFVRQVPHMSFVWGREQVAFLKSRYDGMVKHPFFESMVYTEDPATIQGWAPLLMEGRGDEPVAATKMDGGTDVNFGRLAEELIAWLDGQADCRASVAHRVMDLEQDGDQWRVRVCNLQTGERFDHEAKFVFLGAGGGTLPLLQKAGIPQGRGFGGFPVGGQWLVCDRPGVTEKHFAKVYGQACDSAPTMAVPHLDARIIDGKRALLFGPFASWTSKFLARGGKFTDLPASIRPSNLASLIKVGLKNLDLIRYLVKEGLQTKRSRMRQLRQFYPMAEDRDWRIVDAGIRVQAIKKEDGAAGIVHYGTEIVTDERGTLGALLGASPGASVSVSVMLQVVARCFPHLIGSPRYLEMLGDLDHRDESVLQWESLPADWAANDEALGLSPGASEPLLEEGLVER